MPTDQRRSPDDVLTARDLTIQYGLAPRVAESIVREVASGKPGPHIVSVEEDRSAIAYLRWHILDLLFERQIGLCFLCDQAMPEDYGSMHIHHDPPLCVRMPSGYGRPTTILELHLTHPACNLRHPKPRKPRG